MFKTWRIGRLFGFPIEIGLSFLILLGVVLLWMGGLTGLIVVGVAFGSVLLHELGHALVARHLGVPVSGIELNFFGGAAKMIDQPKSANHEIAIAAAGPAVSLVLSGLGFGIGTAIGSPFIVLVGWINLVIAAFNLLPALPMDGGRILRAVLTRWMDFVRATEISVTVSRVFAIAFVVYGLAFGVLQLVLLAPFLWMLGTHERRIARLMAHRYAYDRDGYARHGGSGFGFHDERRHGDDRDPERPRQILIRTRGGTYIVDLDRR
jgi:Zn-dependent protease